jgi:hypothetical protein
MNLEQFQNLHPEYRRLVFQILENEATEVQINYVLTTNNLDRQTLDEAVGFIKSKTESPPLFVTIVLITFVFFVIQTMFWILEFIFTKLF